MNEGVSRVVEMHYTTSEVAVLLRRSERWVRDKIKEGAFGKVFMVDGDFLITASGVNTYLAVHEYQYNLGIKARNLTELRQKLEKRQQAEAEQQGKAA